MNGLTNDERRARRLIMLGAIMVWVGGNIFTISTGGGMSTILAVNAALLVITGTVAFVHGWQSLDG